VVDQSQISLEIKDAQIDEKTFFKYQVPAKYADVSVETCNLQPAENIAFAKAWAKNPFSTVFIGGYGTGKTHLAFAMLREMFRYCPHKIWPRYFTSPNLDAQLLQAVKSEDGDAHKLKDLGQQDLLFIDDLGRETKSERLKRQYFEILNFRYVNNLPTLLTSNFHLDKLGDLLDGAIASRMQEWAIIEFNGPDLRIFKPNSIK